MDEVKAKQLAKEEVIKKCLNIKEEICEPNEQPKIVEKVIKIIKKYAKNLKNNCNCT